MKPITAFLVGFVIALLAITSYFQNQTITEQRQTILDMRSNPACMVGPTVESQPNPGTPRRSI